MAKTHKTIFGTTEKSNFILNMTNEQFGKTASVMFIIGFCLIFLSSAAAEIIACGPMRQTLFDWKIIPSIGPGIAGILSACIFIIALIKQTLNKKQIAAALITLVLTVFMYISYINAFTTVPDYSAFLGFRYGRYEGLMVSLSYVFIFLGSMSVNSRKTAGNVFRVFSLIMIAESIWAALQFIPSFPDLYYKVPYSIKPVMLPSGAAGSPVFLAVLFSAGLAVSVFGALYDKSKFSVIYKIAVLPVSFFLVKTQTLAGFTGAVVISAAVICECIRSKKGKNQNTAPAVLMFTGFAAALAFILIKGFKIYDGIAIWQDGCTRLSAFGQYSQSIEGSFSLDSITEVYSYLWGRGAETARKFPVTGIGPDAFVFTQRTGILNNVPLSVDRPYNEYLFCAASYGIPAAVSLTALLFFSAANGVRSAVKNGFWMYRASMVTALLTILLSVITNSTATVTPFICFVLGICCCTMNDTEE